MKITKEFSGLDAKEKDSRLAFILYIIYLVSFFLHLPARISLLGSIRFDFILVGVITFFILSFTFRSGPSLDRASKYLLAIFIYAVATLPLVERPGSVIGNGMISFTKAAIFYFFTVNLINSEFRLKAVVFVFITCNFMRVAEPLILNLTTGYLGARTHLGYGEFAGRLSGAPSDIINPNGLAFIIATIIPFLHYVFAPSSKKAFFLYVLMIPILLIAMAMTLSRSGVLAIVVIALGIWIKSIHKVRLIFLGLVGGIIIFTSLNEVQKDRYLSIVSAETRQSSSAEGRIEGWFSDFKVALKRPIVGHGLGTSREANWHGAGKDQISHILWAEIWQEIGLLGLILFLLYLKEMIKNFMLAGELIKSKIPNSSFIFRANQAMQVWLLMNLLFSLASYGLKSYEWYFFGGLSVVMYKLAYFEAKKIDSLSIMSIDNRNRRNKFLLGKRF